MEGLKLDDKQLYLSVKESVLKEIGRGVELSDQELRDCIEAELRRRDKAGLISLQSRRQHAKTVFDSFRKFGILQELIEDGEVTDIMVRAVKNFL